MLTQEKYKKYPIYERTIFENLINKRRLCKAAMKYDIDKHGLIENIKNKVTHCRTTMEPNLKSYFNKLTKLANYFAGRIVRYRTYLSL